MVNVAEKITASAYLGLLKDDINAILVHWPPKTISRSKLKNMRKIEFS